MDISPAPPIDPSALTIGANTSWMSDASAETDPTVDAASSSDALLTGENWSTSGFVQAPATGAPSGAGVFGSVDQGFSALTGFLQREFNALEQQFSGALRSLFSAVSGIGSGSAPTAPAAAAPGTPSPYDGIIRRAAAKNQIDPALITAVMRRESGYDASARSKAGALGLMQLMPETAKQLGVADPFDPQQNVDGGARLLRSLLDGFGGRLDLALAAYNAGPAAVKRYGGVPPYPETQAYVRDVMADYRGLALGSKS